MTKHVRGQRQIRRERAAARLIPRPVRLERNVFTRSLAQSGVVAEIERPSDEEPTAWQLHTSAPNPKGHEPMQQIDMKETNAVSGGSLCWLEWLISPVGAILDGCLSFEITDKAGH